MFQKEETSEKTKLEASVEKNRPAFHGNSLIKGNNFLGFLSSLKVVSDSGKNEHTHTQPTI